MAPAGTTKFYLFSKVVRTVKVLYCRSTSPTPSKSMKESFSSAMPEALKAECLVRVKDEDPEKQKQRQELVRAMSPAELAQISSLSDFPVPKLFSSKKR